MLRLSIALFWAAAVALLPCAASSHPGPGDGFDCPNEKAPMERIVCADSQLSGLDLSMSELYLKLLKDATNAGDDKTKKDLQDSQRLWRKIRNTDCHLGASGELSIEDTIRARTCLLNIYRRRVAELSDRDLNGDAVTSPQTNIIQRECLFVFDDSFGVHSVEWNLTTTYKKLRHCYELQLRGPNEVKIGDVGKEFVNGCIQKGLNDSKTRHVVQGIIALGVDIFSAGSTGGTATATAITAYVNNVVNVTLDCVTNVESISNLVQEKFRDSISGRVEHVSNWVYFKL